eukprot:1042222-Pelagomonas_calceolata.AAC.1
MLACLLFGQGQSQRSLTDSLTRTSTGDQNVLAAKASSFPHSSLSGHKETITHSRKKTLATTCFTRHLIFFLAFWELPSQMGFATALQHHLP